MTRFFFKFKTLYFWPTSTNFGGKKCFPKKPGIHNLIQFLVPCRNSEKPNDPIPRKQHNTQQDGKMTDPLSWNPSGYCWGSNKYNCSRLAFESQRYRVCCWFGQKLLSHNEHAKNQLNL